MVILNDVIEDAKASKESRLIFKVNFSKAYDSLDWSYLVDMLRIMNFPAHWIGWIKECISTTFVNILVHGSPSGEFRIEQGIRQRYPLLPYPIFGGGRGPELVNKESGEGGADRCGKDEMRKFGRVPSTILGHHNIHG